MVWKKLQRKGFPPKKDKRKIAGARSPFHDVLKRKERIMTIATI